MGHRNVSAFHEKADVPYPRHNFLYCFKLLARKGFNTPMKAGNLSSWASVTRGKTSTHRIEDCSANDRGRRRYLDHRERADARPGDDQARVAGQKLAG